LKEVVLLFLLDVFYIRTHRGIRGKCHNAKKKKEEDILKSHDEPRVFGWASKK
jgi:hypothetical protein